MCVCKLQVAACSFAANVAMGDGLSEQVMALVDLIQAAMERHKDDAALQEAALGAVRSTHNTSTETRAGTTLSDA